MFANLFQQNFKKQLFRKNQNIPYSWVIFEGCIFHEFCKKNFREDCTRKVTTQVHGCGFQLIPRKLISRIAASISKFAKYTLVENNPLYTVYRTIRQLYIIIVQSGQTYIHVHTCNGAFSSQMPVVQLHTYMYIVCLSNTAIGFIHVHTCIIIHMYI